MILHTEAYEGARPRVLRHNRLLRAVIMTALIPGMDGQKTRQNIYVSAALITRWTWSKETENQEGVSRFSTVDLKLKNGGSAGATFNAMPGLRCRQNRLALWEVPAWVIPSAIRAMVDGVYAQWRIEVYCLGGLDKKTMRFEQYGVFVEFAPASTFLPRRVSLGVRSFWRLARKDKEYVHRLLANRNVTRRHVWQKAAYWVAQLKAGVLLLPLCVVMLTSRH